MCSRLIFCQVQLSKVFSHPIGHLFFLLVCYAEAFSVHGSHCWLLPWFSELAHVQKTLSCACCPQVFLCYSRSCPCFRVSGLWRLLIFVKNGWYLLHVNIQLSHHHLNSLFTIYIILLLCRGSGVCHYVHLYLRRRATLIKPKASYLKRYMTERQASTKISQKIKDMSSIYW